jgi:hypothetical protein
VRRAAPHWSHRTCLGVSTSACPSRSGRKRRTYSFIAQCRTLLPAAMRGSTGLRFRLVSTAFLLLSHGCPSNHSLAHRGASVKARPGRQRNKQTNPLEKFRRNATSRMATMPQVGLRVLLPSVPRWRPAAVRCRHTSVWCTLHARRRTYLGRVGGVCGGVLCHMHLRSSGTYCE